MLKVAVGEAEARVSMGDHGTRTVTVEAAADAGSLTLFDASVDAATEEKLRAEVDQFNTDPAGSIRGIVRHRALADYRAIVRDLRKAAKTHAALAKILAG